MRINRWITLLFSAALLFAVSCAEKAGDTGPAGAPAPPPPFNEPTAAYESCLACHMAGGAYDPADVGRHATPPLVAANRYNPTITGITITAGATVAADETVTVAFKVDDDAAAAVNGLTDADIRFTFAQLVPDVTGGTANWSSYLMNSTGTQAAYQYADTVGGVFVNNGDGTYTYTFGDDVSALLAFTDLSANGNTHRIATQISSGVSNGWFDFVPTALTLGTPSTVPVADPRQIVTTATCNTCHNADGDGDGLALHGSGRRDVEYCVTCHNPDSTDPESGNTVDMKVMVHKIHFGKELPSVKNGGSYQIIGYRDSVHDYSTGGFPQPINDCTTCHVGGTASANWKELPTMATCTSCHDNIVFDGSGDGVASINHTAGAQIDDSNCSSCHDSAGSNPIVEKHRWDQIKAAATGYSYVINSATFDDVTGEATVNYDILKGGTQMVVASDPEWAETVSGASRLSMNFGWKGIGEADYTNPGTGESAPGSAPGVDLLVPANYTLNVGGDYTAVVALPDDAADAGTGIVFIEGHPAVAVITTTPATLDRIPVDNANVEFVINDAAVDGRRAVVDLANCQACHDTLSLHGSNRNNDITVCTTCHNSANTDIPVRPGVTADGLVEQAIDFKYMIHRIHKGRNAYAGGITVYGHGGSLHEYKGEFPPGTPLNECSVCHISAAEVELPLVDGMQGTTILSGVLADQTDDLNISPTAAVCSSCHDGVNAVSHMKERGSRFSVLEDDIFY